MSPERSITINGCRVEEYYWAGEIPVYVDHHFYACTFEQAVFALENGWKP